MFSGIVERTGTIRSTTPAAGGGARLVIAAPGLAGELAPGESVCVQGACLTTVTADAKAFTVDLVPETVRRTVFARLAAGAEVNLERSLSYADRISGHLVTGHVDGVGVVSAVAEEGGGRRLVVTPPKPLMRYLVEKGSITVDGVSLTVAAAGGDRFEVALIPYTLEHTTLKALVPGGRVNLEADLMAKYLERLLLERQGLLERRDEVSLADLIRLVERERT